MNAKPSSRWIAGVALAAALLAGGIGMAARLTAAPDTATPVTPVAADPGRHTSAAGRLDATPAPAARETIAANPYIVRNVKVYDLNGQLAYQGDVDVKPTFDRIAAGIRDPHRNDGSVYQNRERLLPIKGDREYYREYVVRTPGLTDVGPQRVVVGKDGDGWYTPDHYDSFVRIK